jgi:hypothetical protein
MSLVDVKPLFVDDLDDLKAELRLTGADETKDVEHIIRRGVLDFRVGFAHRAGLTLLTGLQAITFKPDPTTEDEYRRAAARLLEIKSVWRFLLQQLRALFADSSGGAFQGFNDEGVLRQLDSDDLEVLFEQCDLQIEELYQLILGFESLGEDSGIHAFDGTQVPLREVDGTGTGHHKTHRSSRCRGADPTHSSADCGLHRCQHQTMWWTPTRSRALDLGRDRTLPWSGVSRSFRRGADGQPDHYRSRWCEPLSTD